MRIGVFGGSFDPVHHGHLLIAQQAAEQLKLDQVRFVPVRVQPLKATGPHAAPEDRVAMLEAALAADPRFVLDLRELRRAGASYTVDTLRELKAESPGDQLFLVLGADAARELPRWREAAQLPALATLVIVPRAGSPATEAPPGAISLDLESVDVSATAVRAAVAHGQSIDGLVPAPVARYIATHRLYRTGT